MGATMMAGVPPTFGRRSGRWLSLDALRTWPSLGWTTCSRTAAAALSAATRGAAAVSTSMSWVTTATVAVIRSEMSPTTPARSASCRARPDRYRYTVTSSRRAAFSRSRRSLLVPGSWPCWPSWLCWPCWPDGARTGDQSGSAMLAIIRFRVVWRHCGRPQTESLTNSTSGDQINRHFHCEGLALLEYRDVYAGGRLVGSGSADVITIV